jgi:hypothetical protein
MWRVVGRMTLSTRTFAEIYSHNSKKVANMPFRMVRAVPEMQTTDGMALYETAPWASQCGQMKRVTSIRCIDPPGSRQYSMSAATLRIPRDIELFLEEDLQTSGQHYLIIIGLKCPKMIDLT